MGEWAERREPAEPLGILQAGWRQEWVDCQRSVPFQWCGTDKRGNITLRLKEKECMDISGVPLKSEDWGEHRHGRWEVAAGNEGGLPEAKCFAPIIHFKVHSPKFSRVQRAWPP